MKANAPEKLYLIQHNGLICYCRNNDNDIEYTRTDVFIKKAARFLKEWDAYRVCLEGHKDWFIEQFKKYMEE